MNSVPRLLPSHLLALFVPDGRSGGRTWAALVWTQSLTGAGVQAIRRGTGRPPCMPRAPRLPTAVPTQSPGLQQLERASRGSWSPSPAPCPVASSGGPGAHCDGRSGPKTLPGAKARRANADSPLSFLFFTRRSLNSPRQVSSEPVWLTAWQE